MQNQSETFSANTVDAGVESLRALASATTRYFEAPPEYVEAARIEYETVLTRFNNSRTADGLTQEQ